jgi:hypothetical protein
LAYKLQEVCKQNDFHWPHDLKKKVVQQEELYKQKQQQTLEAAKSYENFENFEK